MLAWTVANLRRQVVRKKRMNHHNLSGLLEELVVVFEAENAIIYVNAGKPKGCTEVQDFLQGESDAKAWPLKRNGTSKFPHKLFWRALQVHENST